MSRGRWDTAAAILLFRIITFSEMSLLRYNQNSYRRSYRVLANHEQINALTRFRKSGLAQCHFWSVVLGKNSILRIYFMFGVSIRQVWKSKIDFSQSFGKTRQNRAVTSFKIEFVNCCVELTFDNHFSFLPEVLKMAEGWERWEPEINNWPKIAIYWKSRDCCCLRIAVLEP